MKKNGIDVVKIIGLIGLALGTLATAVSQYAQEKEMERLIEEKIEEANSKKEK